MVRTARPNQLKEADYQSPEGFYSVSARARLNPHSKLLSAFNVGYPNASIARHGRTEWLVVYWQLQVGGLCFAMHDRARGNLTASSRGDRRGPAQWPVQYYLFHPHDGTARGSLANSS